VIPIYLIAIAFFSLFFLVFLAYYFFKAETRFDFVFRTPVKLPQNVGERKRVHPRTDINWPVSFETSDGTITAELTNISLGGAFIRCEKPLPMGEVFCLTMLVPDDTPVSATAVVVWSNANLPDERVINRGMGVRFIKMSDRHIQLVREMSQESK
jgi:uncharacterized protein (TIGR02266 family)